MVPVTMLFGGAGMFVPNVDKRKIMQMKTKPISIYWTGDPVPSDRHNQNFFHAEPQTLWDNVVEEYTINPDTYDEGVTIPGPSVMACPGWQDLTRHTLLIKVPMSGAYKINGTKVEPVGLPSMFSGQVVRHPSFAGHKLFNFRMPMYFFADEPVQMTLTSPWFHKPGYTKYAAIVPGRYDIGSWYRALSFEMSMWEEDADYIEFTEGEPIAYLTFDTNKPINLIKYSGTENLRRIGSLCETAGHWEPRVPLLKRYKRFKEGKMREEVLREIESGLVEKRCPYTG